MYLVNGHDVSTLLMRGKNMSVNIHSLDFVWDDYLVPVSE
jgi:hypothetical protein